MKRKIAIGSDHAGFHLKNEIIEKLEAEGHEVVDYGCPSEESIDYPDYAHPVANLVEKEQITGILICGSGNGISMSANKHSGVRCALCWSMEIAELARQHNDANIISLPARYISSKEALKCVSTFLTTDFEGGRHQRRVDKIACA
ncbi:MAG: ribose 5-phosphate isomerase B [Crocinitomicaceae bacterium]|nr:ribose 5-phosphate isomerase B [Crocinitomicaceae bacterium]MDG1734434.1 ribose 5-phosphate isomerase B [Crocinitomicaceae bacterium]MDG2505124.1 ribose 5-phosphate isomerase B [Crocinitomicaceae bacterium]